MRGGCEGVWSEGWMGGSDVKSDELTGKDGQKEKKVVTKQDKGKNEGVTMGNENEMKRGNMGEV